jgi:hypothetical protein
VVPAEPALRPRELQSRLRAGATAEELAAEAGLDVEHVRRYEWPVMAEREHVIGLVRAHRLVGADGDAVLGEVADARLAARGVRAGEATWAARREGSAPWLVEVRFAAGDRERSARWTFDVRGRVVTPLDDEARWLSQPDDPVTPEVLGVPSLVARRVAPPVDDESALLRVDLADRRGQRPGARQDRPAGPSSAPADRDVAGMLPLGDVPMRERGPARSEEPEPVAQASVVELGRWNPRRSRDRSVSPGAGPGATQPPLPLDGDAATPVRGGSETAGEDNPAPEQTPAQSPVTVNAATRPATPARGVPAARRSGRKGRAQVPSWDEIVFGARPEN